jgi:hypothetical protein
MICSLKKSIVLADQLSSPPNWNSAISWKVLIDPEIESWFNGRATAFDISVTHPAAFTYYKAAAKKDNAAATEREIGKIKKYEEAMALNPIPANFIFKPLVVESSHPSLSSNRQITSYGIRIGQKHSYHSYFPTAFCDPSDQKCRHAP